MAQDDATEWVSAESLEAWAGNPKKHPKPQVEALVQSLSRFGWITVLAVHRPTRRIIAGHGRRLAALAAAKAKITIPGAPGLGMVPVRWFEGSWEEAKAANVADNRLAELGSWDNALLATAVADMDAATRAVVGFSESEAAALLAERPVKLQKSRLVTRVKAKQPVSRPGEIYQLGPHRLACGDSTARATWEVLLGDERIDAVWSDPPYGVSYEGAAGKIDNDDLGANELRRFLEAALGNAAWASRAGAAWWIAAPAGPLSHEFGSVLNRLGIWKSSPVWVKDALVLGRGDIHYRHEALFYGWMPGGGHYWCGARNVDSVIEVPRPKTSKLHPTMKPVALVVRCLEWSSQEGNLVADPFGGSGSTLMACAETGRRARTIELNPKFCDVIRVRWTDFAKRNGLDAGPGALEAATIGAELEEDERGEAPNA